MVVLVENLDFPIDLDLVASAEDILVDLLVLDTADTEGCFDCMVDLIQGHNNCNILMFMVKLE